MLCGHGHQVVNFYLVQVLFSICKTTQEICIRYYYLGFPESSVGRESTYNAGDPGSIPGLGRSIGEGIGYPLQYSGLEKSMDCIVHWVTELDTTE